MGSNNGQSQLLDRLTSCAAVRSLSSEQRIVSLLQQLGWSVSHGSYLPDVKTQKWREIDLLATRCWRLGLINRPQTVEIVLPIEVKSIRDYHFVFAPRAEEADYETLDREWIGYHQNRLVESLEVGGADADEIVTTFDWFESACATDDGCIRVGGLFVDPLAATFKASAFRETNIGNDRARKSSVLWNAMQSVHGMVQSSKNQWLDRIFNCVTDSVSFAHRIRRTVSEVVATEIYGAVEYVCHYHPIVIVESHLWSNVEGNLRPEEWCRFYRLGCTPEVWCDVVADSAVSNYLNQLSTFYQQEMIDRSASPFPGTAEEKMSRFKSILAKVISFDDSDPRLL